MLANGNVHDSIVKMVEESIRDNVAQYTAGDDDHTGWNLDGLRSYYHGWLADDSDFRYTPQQLEDADRGDIADELIARAMKIYDAKEQQYGSDTMREIERVVLLSTVDRYWMDHIDNMDAARHPPALHRAA